MIFVNNNKITTKGDCKWQDEIKGYLKPREVKVISREWVKEDEENVLKSKRKCYQLT